jgi:hypothetical protein
MPITPEQAAAAVSERAELRERLAQDPVAEACHMIDTSLRWGKRVLPGSTHGKAWSRATLREVERLYACAGWCVEVSTVEGQRYVTFRD